MFLFALGEQFSLYLSLSLCSPAPGGGVGYCFLGHSGHVLTEFLSAEFHELHETLLEVPASCVFSVVSMFFSFIAIDVAYEVAEKCELI